MEIVGPNVQADRRGIAPLPVALAEGQSLSITIADEHLCFLGEGEFADPRSDETASINGPARIVAPAAGDGNNQTGGQVTIRQSDASSDGASVSVTSSGGTTTIGTTTIASGETEQVAVNLNPDGNQIINFDFEADDEAAGNAGAVRVAIPNPNAPEEDLAVETEIFFVDAVVNDPEPCEDHELFPEDVVFGGDITMTFIDGNLTLTGDGANNGIAVFTDTRGVVVQPIGGTTLNGSTDAIVIAGGIAFLAGDLLIPSLGEGDDFLCIEDLRIIGETDITSTPGDDIVVINNVDFDLLVDIDVGMGNDTIDLSGTTADIAIRVSLGDGDDVFVGSEGQDIVSGGAGIDIIDGRGGNDRITGDAGADIQRGGDGDDQFTWNNGDGPDDSFGEAGNDRFLFNGADGAADVLRLAPASNVGEAGDGTHSSAEFDLTRVEPSAFTIEGSGIESVVISSLGGDDQIDASPLPPDLVDILLSGGGAVTTIKSCPI